MEEDLKKKGDESKDSSFPIADTRELEECQKLKEEYLAGWQRARADFLNYKKEEMERIGELLSYASEELVLKILPILDNFEIAVKEVRSTKYEGKNVEEIIKGFLQIKTQLEDFLKNQGVEEIKAVGEAFDPNLHEVVEEIEVKDKEPGIIGEEDKSSSLPFAAARVIEEVQKGYKINGRLLRPARVKVVK